MYRFNKFTILLLEETTIRFTHAVLTGPSRTAAMRAKGAQTDGGSSPNRKEEEGGNRGGDCSEDSVHGDEATFGRISQDINALNAFFSRVFPSLTQVLGEAGNKDESSDSGGSGATSTNKATRRASLMAETESVDEGVLIVELLNQLAKFLVLDPQIVATQALRSISMYAPFFSLLKASIASIRCFYCHDTP